MTHSTGRRVAALVGGLLFWFGAGTTLLFVAAAIWLLAEGSQPSWVLLVVTIVIALLGAGIVRWSRVPISKALNTGL